MKRHITHFSNQADYSGWWCKSPKGAIAQLRRLQARDIRGYVRYRMDHQEPICIGGTTIWTIGEITEAGISIRPTREDLNDVATAKPTEPEPAQEAEPSPAPAGPRHRILRRQG